MDRTYEQPLPKPKSTEQRKQVGPSPKQSVHFGIWYNPPLNNTCPASKLQHSSRLFKLWANSAAVKRLPRWPWGIEIQRVKLAVADPMPSLSPLHLRHQYFDAPTVGKRNHAKTQRWMTARDEMLRKPFLESSSKWYQYPSKNSAFLDKIEIDFKQSEIRKLSVLFGWILLRSGLILVKLGVRSLSVEIFDISRTTFVAKSNPENHNWNLFFVKLWKWICANAWSSQSFRQLYPVTFVVANCRGVLYNSSNLPHAPWLCSIAPLPPGSLRPQGQVMRGL